MTFKINVDASSQPKSREGSMCAECGQHRALFRIKRGKKVRADKLHTLCFKCSRAHLNRNRGVDLSYGYESK